MGIVDLVIYWVFLVVGVIGLVYVTVLFIPVLIHFPGWVMGLLARARSRRSQG